MNVVPPGLSEIERARDALGDLVVETPVFHCRSGVLQQAVGKGTDAIMKLELMQYAGSFKPRGALTVMKSLSQEELSRGVTAISAGNHAIAVGYAAKVMGTHPKVVMPQNANAARVARCNSFGAEVVLTKDVHEGFEEVRRIEKQEGRFFVHPFEGPLTALGTATLGLEFCRQIPDLDAVIIPIGGGGLCAGTATAIKLIQPDCQIFGVEPIGADTMSKSLAAGSPQAIDKVRSIADSLGAPHAAPYSFALCQAVLDGVVLVDDDALCRSMAMLFNEMKLAVEPAGAAALAALCGPLRERLEGKRVGLIVCGANIDIVRFQTYIRRGCQQACP